MTEQELEFYNMLQATKIPVDYFYNASYEYRYFFRSLLQKIDSSIKFKNLPKSWPNDFFMLCLWARGYVAVFQSMRFGDTDANNIAFQPCTNGGGPLDFYYQPTQLMISNPYYTKSLKVGSECEMIKLTPDAFWKGGTLDIIDFYSRKLSELSKGIDQGLINSKLPMILSANNEAQSETLKAVYDRVQQGQPLVITKEDNDGGEIIPSKEPFQVWQNDFRITYVVSQMLDDYLKIMDEFYMEIGLPTQLDKASHVLNQEADFQAKQSQARIETWKTTLKESLEKVNDLFGTNIEIEEEKENDSISNLSQSEINDSRNGKLLKLAK